MRQPQDQTNSFPRDRDELLRDFGVAIRLRDIRESMELKDRLMPKWWEALVGLLMFAATLGFLASVFHQLVMEESPFFRIIVFWMSLMILMFVFAMNLVYFRLHHLRRAYEINLRLVQDVTRRLEAVEYVQSGQGEEPGPAPQGDTSPREH